MGDHLSFIEALLVRLQGPMSFRFIIQPLMAILLAFLDGRRDAREGRPPYFWGLFTHPEHRGEMLWSGIKSIGKVFVVAVVLDLVFQHIVFHEIRWEGAAPIAGIILAVIPYLLLRGPINRLMRYRGKGHKR